MPRSRFQRLLGILGMLAVLAILGFLMLPLVVVATAAFNSSALPSFPPQHLSLRWFANAIGYPDFRAGLANSLVVTPWSASIALVIGATFALAIERYEFRFKPLLEGVLVSPLFVPHFTIGLAFLILAVQISLVNTYAVVIACHVILVLPFVLRSVYISLRNLDQRLELAAASLGAPPRRVLVTVTLPLLMPGLVSGWLFGVLLSLNEFTASLFVTGQRTQTLPVAMYNYVRDYSDPSMAALAVMYIVGVAVLLTIANAFLGLGKVLNVERRT
jgi:putative spermidine/putrescine transport system permease protein